MRWMEFIKVQTGKNNVKEVLKAFVKDCKECHGLLEAKVFNHTYLDDCSICLLWKTDRAEPQGSIIGLALSNALKRFGLVDHTVWAEESILRKDHHEVCK